jgi:hypothetical protein
MAQAIFLLIIIYFGAKAWGNFMKINRNINLGRDEKIEGNTGERWRNVFLVALGQKKMFKNMIPAVLHFFIYAAFVITQIELIEIFMDGAFGVHRLFAPILGGFYTFIISFIEILSVLAFIATVAFIARRNFLKVERFQKPELKGFPTLDANIMALIRCFKK